MKLILEGVTEGVNEGREEADLSRIYTIYISERLKGNNAPN